MTSPGIYQHYKGSQYEVIGIGKIEATEESCIVYRSLAPGPRGPAGQIWVRPVESFEGEVEVDGKSVPRFRKIS